MKTQKLIMLAVLIILVIIIIGVYFVMSSNKVKEEALKLYNQKKAGGMEFNSQCLGTIEIDGIGYAVDIVHVPRTQEDNLSENQCEDYRNRKVSHFVELDKDGNVVRVV
jgi:hypothetical protein